MCEARPNVYGTNKRNVSFYVPSHLFTPQVNVVQQKRHRQRFKMRAFLLPFQTWACLWYLFKALRLPWKFHSRQILCYNRKLEEMKMFSSRQFNLKTLFSEKSLVSSEWRQFKWFSTPILRITSVHDRRSSLRPWQNSCVTSARQCARVNNCVLAIITMFNCKSPCV